MSCILEHPWNIDLDAFRAWMFPFDCVTPVTFKKYETGDGLEPPLPPPNWYECYCIEFKNVSKKPLQASCITGEGEFSFVIRNVGDCCEPKYEYDYSIVWPCNLSGIDPAEGTWFRKIVQCDKEAIRDELGLTPDEQIDCEKLVKQYCDYQGHLDDSAWITKQYTKSDITLEKHNDSIHVTIPIDVDLYRSNYATANVVTYTLYNEDAESFVYEGTLYPLDGSTFPENVKVINQKFVITSSKDFYEDAEFYNTTTESQIDDAHKVVCAKYEHSNVLYARKIYKNTSDDLPVYLNGILCELTDSSTRNYVPPFYAYYDSDDEVGYIIGPKLPLLYEVRLEDPKPKWDLDGGDYIYNMTKVDYPMYAGMLAKYHPDYEEPKAPIQLVAFTPADGSVLPDTTANLCAIVATTAASAPTINLYKNDTAIAPTGISSAISVGGYNYFIAYWTITDFVALHEQTEVTLSITQDFTSGAYTRTFEITNDYNYYLDSDRLVKIVTASYTSEFVYVRTTRKVDKVMDDDGNDFYSADGYHWFYKTTSWSSGDKVAAYFSDGSGGYTKMVEIEPVNSTVSIQSILSAVPTYGNVNKHALPCIVVYPSLYSSTEGLTGLDSSIRFEARYPDEEAEAKTSHTISLGPYTILYSTLEKHVNSLYDLGRVSYSFYYSGADTVYVVNEQHNYIYNPEEEYYGVAYHNYAVVGTNYIYAKNCDTLYGITSGAAYSMEQLVPNLFQKLIKDNYKFVYPFYSCTMTSADAALANTDFNPDVTPRSSIVFELMKESDFDNPPLDMYSVIDNDGLYQDHIFSAQVVDSVVTDVTVLPHYEVPGSPRSSSTEVALQIRNLWSSTESAEGLELILYNKATNIGYGPYRIVHHVIEDDVFTLQGSETLPPLDNNTLIISGVREFNAAIGLFDYVVSSYNNMLTIPGKKYIQPDGTIVDGWVRVYNSFNDAKYILYNKRNSVCKYFWFDYIPTNEIDVSDSFVYTKCSEEDCGYTIIMDKGSSSCPFTIKVRGKSINFPGCGGGGMSVEVYISCPNNVKLPATKPTAPCNCAFVISYLLSIPLGAVLL